MKQTYCATPGPGETRKCLDPWVFVYVRSSGLVDGCCRGMAIGDTRESTLEEILNGPKAVTLREQLLTGNLPPECVSCATRGVTTVEDLRDKVEQTLFDPGYAEQERLRREIRAHRSERAELLKERAGLREHVEAIEGLLEDSRQHARNLEEIVEQQDDRLRVFDRGVVGRLRAIARHLRGQRR